MRRILIVEDNTDILNIEKDYLEANKFEVDTTVDGEIGLQMALNGNYDLVILDVMLPGCDGLEICKKLREKTQKPILIVSAKKETADKIRGLGFGADDYISKPFSPNELVARAIAHIHRYETLTGDSQKIEDNYQIGSLTIDRKSRRVYVNGTEVTFTNKEFDLLDYLAKSPDQVYSKDEIFKTIWGYDAIGETSTVTVHINRIRDKLTAIDSNFDSIHTIWGKGYRYNN